VATDPEGCRAPRLRHVAAGAAEMYGFDVGPIKERAARATLVATRALRPLLPRGIDTSPRTRSGGCVSVAARCRARSRRSGARRDQAGSDEEHPRLDSPAWGCGVSCSTSTACSRSRGRRCRGPSRPSMGCAVERCHPADYEHHDAHPERIWLPRWPTRIRRRAGEIVTAVVATASFLRAHHPEAGVFVLSDGDASEDLAGSSSWTWTTPTSW